MISRRNHPVLGVSDHPTVAEYVHPSLATILKDVFRARMRSLKPQTCLDSTATIRGLVRHHHCPSRGAAPVRTAYLKGEVTMLAAMATFLFHIRMYTRPGDWSVRYGDNSPLSTTRSNWLVNPGHRLPCDVCTMEKRWFSWRSGGIDHPRALPWESSIGEM